MVAKKTAAKRPAKKTTKKALPKPSGMVRIKVIQSVDSAPGKDTTVHFSDGTKAVIESGNKLSKMLTKSENVAPNRIKVTLSKGNIVDAEPIKD